VSAHDCHRQPHPHPAAGLSPTVADSNTYTPVHAAASYGQHAVLCVACMRCLHTAADAPNSRYLLSHASAPTDAANVRDSDGDTPLFVVEDIPSAMLLLQLGADAKLTNEAGETVRGLLLYPLPQY